MNAVRLGRAILGGKNLWLDPGAPHHLLLSGRTRSGKSSALYAILAQLVRNEAVVIAGVDPTGILFSALDGVPGEGLRASTGRDPESVGRVIDGLLSLMDERIDALLASGLDKLEAFSPKTPLVVVVLEEYAALIELLRAADRASGAKVVDRLAPKVEAGVLRLCAEGAKVGLRVIISTQHASSEVLTTAVRAQLANRISFAQGAIGLGMVHEDLPDFMRDRGPTFKPGEGIAELEGAPPVTFRADYCDYQAFRRLVREALARREPS